VAQKSKGVVPIEARTPADSIASLVNSLQNRVNGKHSVHNFERKH